MKKNNQAGNIKIILIVLAALYLVAVVFFYSWMRWREDKNPEPVTDLKNSNNLARDLSTLQKFKSEEDFKKYLAEVESSFSYSFGGRGGFAMENLAEGDISLAPKGTNLPMAAESPEPGRFSGTNVQVPGIDEPDIVKTDGKEIFFSTNDIFSGLIAPSSERIGIVPPPRQSGVVKNIKAFPLDELKLDSQIQKSGDLLLKDNILVVLPPKSAYGAGERRVYAYDVRDPSAPKEVWSVELKGKVQLKDARLFGDKLYVVSANTVDQNRPCPIDIMSSGYETHTVKCLDIYHPAAIVPVDVTYSVTVLNTASGKMEDMMSFVGSSADSVLYMSENSLYMTYYYPGDFIGFAVGFFKENSNLVSDDLVRNLEKLSTYQIGGNAKMTEYNEILERYFSSLEPDKELMIKNELANKLQDYFRDHRRDLEQTGIVKIGVRGLDLEASGTVTGKPLNQFSLGEHENNLRIATTIGNNWWWFGFGNSGQRETTNDVYVLDGSLRAIGEIKDLGLEERIYSARFIGDKGYLVTFKQIDPFFVLDMSDPKNPKKSGELKIPGYSSYLHPISNDRILGIGEENSQVKATLFDVSNPVNPRELSTYKLDEYWSEAASNHHAFLLDPEHKVFFLPGGQGGYVISYANDKLELKCAVAEIAARRAVYIEDFLYILADGEVVVLDERSWVRVKELSL